tara:strand:+ start:2970 stop:3722 length:753 start_codon:yes stop_codon:yes gene_type:complete
MEGPGVMSDEKDVFEQYLQERAREEGIIMSFDDAEWQLKKVNAELKKVNREINDLREIVTALQQGESLTEALGAVESLTEALGAAEEDKESQCQCGFSHRGPCLKYDDKMVPWQMRDQVHKRHYLEWTPLVDHILKNDFWEEVAETDEECPRYDAIYAPKPGEVWRLGTAWNDQSEILPNGNDFVTALEKHPYVDTVQTHEFGCVTVITFHALGNKFDWHYKFDLYQVGDVVQEVMYTACRWPDEGYSTP